MFVFFITPIPPTETELTHCQPHEVEGAARHLGIPLVPESTRRRRCGHAAHDFAEGYSSYNIASPQHEEEMHGEVPVCHNHLWFEVPDGYQIPPEVELRLTVAMAANECRPKLVRVSVPVGATSIAGEALTFPGHEVCRSFCGGSISFVSNPEWPYIEVCYCCFDCKNRHDAVRCAATVASLPDPTTRPQRKVLTTEEKRISLARPLVLSGGQVATHEIVQEDVLEDKVLYHERLRQWYMVSRCWG